MIPHFGEPSDAEALYDPAESVVRSGDGMPDVPRGVILGFQGSLGEQVAAEHDRIDPHPARELSYYRLSASVAYCPVERVGVGAPVAAIAAEKAIAAGAGAVVVLAGCGAFQPDTPADSVLLPTRAVRDEGASHHYLPADRTVRATPSLVDALAGAFADAGTETERGPVWTTSALFRETLPAIEHYRDRGFVSVDMESAAVYAVCRYRGADAATVHHVDDYLSPDAWVDPEDRGPTLAERLGPTVDGLEAALA